MASGGSLGHLFTPLPSEATLNKSFSVFHHYFLSLIGLFEDECCTYLVMASRALADTNNANNKRKKYKKPERIK